jgi:hypothetical protein
MIRILLIFVVPVVLPTGLYVLWRALMPVNFGGSRAIAREEWEPLPWFWLGIAGGVLMLATFVTVIIYPEFFGT